eukprot:TRINITY_DN14117_c0_g1_i1.p1 TRINITY_DN14117_c0_g1~~TRINITY_DN14117_c0_g1_i1.p1  ORF type:complete len:1017 (-),score=251.02 TRINITY_DN14117_c0_g1_i1:41-3091(-)
MFSRAPPPPGPPPGEPEELENMAEVAPTGGGGGRKGPGAFAAKFPASSRGSASSSAASSLGSSPSGASFAQLMRLSQSTHAPIQEDGPEDPQNDILRATLQKVAAKGNRHELSPGVDPVTSSSSFRSVTSHNKNESFASGVSPHDFGMHGARRSSSDASSIRGVMSSVASLRRTPSRLSEATTHKSSRRGSLVSQIGSFGCYAKIARLFACLRPYCRAVMKNRPYQVLMLIALLVALFLPDLWVIIDRPSNSDLDVILTVVMLLFVVELTVQSIGLSRTYLGSFFFWMDLLGTASVLLDVSYLPLMQSSQGKSGSSIVILRAARVAKLAARAGRFSKIVKLLRFLPGMRAPVGESMAKVISNRLVTALSMRVSCLIIVMVIALPMFTFSTFPEQDWSMQSWLEILEKELVKSPESFKAQFAQFSAAYREKSYFPFRLQPIAGFDMPKELADFSLTGFARGPPAHPRNAVRLEGDILFCDFNFTVPNQMDAWMNAGVQLFIMSLIVMNALMLSNFVSGVVLQPLEKLMVQVNKMTSTISKSVHEMTSTMRAFDENGTAGLDDDNEENPLNETQQLELVLQKLAVLSNIAMQKSIVDADVLEALSEGEKNILHGYNNSFQPAQRSSSKKSRDGLDNEHDEDHEEALLAQKAIVENAGLSLDLINSFNLNPLELDRARNQAAAMFFLNQNHGVSVHAVQMRDFLEEVEKNYKKEAPYHNWYHAVDVAHCVYRLLLLCNGEAYFNSYERYGLLVSAIAHDLGHMGFNNIFLTETSHELALRYNDRSPLENMHCAKLFEIVVQPRCNIFESMSRQQYKDVRKVCIEAILHTDNAHHFVMVKEVQMLYEVNSETLKQLRVDPDDHTLKPTRDVIECFRQPDSLKLLLSLFLHFADISNPMKPFRICRIWAAKIIEEFFVQGDKEKALGVPVQALNDRDKVNRPFSQVGFIEFLVSPLALVVVKILPPVEPFAAQMVTNAATWHQYWLSETQPPPSDGEKRAVADRIAKLQGKFSSIGGEHRA